ncbi:MAG: RNA polymerase sigma factor, partial [Lachnospiraceae bacterium]|nr:RNA polymerase sigma factor [Lachnospiraceae bacterium]
MSDREKIISAVEAAKRGEQKGFSYLYESTYREKYYIAIKYMKNEAEADDVLQDAYIKAWERLDSLKEAEKFSAWLGQIVAHTALDALKKKEPLSFTDLKTEDAESEELFYEPADERIEGQPELAYTEKERSEMLRTMIDALSEKQRMCVLMFYIEGMDVKEISEVLECSTNTVKSHLHYGRQNIRKAAEILQAKGYEFFGLAPIPVFLYLLQMEAAENGVILPLLAGGGIAGGVSGLVALRDFVLNTILGEHLARTIGGLLAVSLAVGGTYLANRQSPVKNLHPETAAETEAEAEKNSPKRSSSQKITERITASEKPSEQANPLNEAPAMQNQREMEKPQIATEAPDYETITLKDEDYPKIIEGGLEKEDLEALLASSPERIENGRLSKSEISSLILGYVGNMGIPPMLLKADPDFENNDEALIAKSVINQLLSAITDYRLRGRSSTVPEITIMGDYVYTGGYIDVPINTEGKNIIWNRAEILTAKRRGDELLLRYSRTGDLDYDEKEYAAELISFENEQQEEEIPEDEESILKDEEALEDKEEVLEDEECPEDEEEALEDEKCLEDEEEILEYEKYPEDEEEILKDEEEDVPENEDKVLHIYEEYVPDSGEGVFDDEEEEAPDGDVEVFDEEEEVLNG